MSDITINGKTEIYGIIGNPVGHSFSPRMHSNAFRHLGINSVYLPFPIHESDLPHLLRSFDILGIKGFNVTVPYKEAIVPFLTELDSSAELLGSVNTVIKTKKGWKGFSTDGSGFVRALTERGVNPTTRKMLLVGAGGSAKAVALAMVGTGISEIHLQNRTESKAHALANLIAKINDSVRIKINPEHSESYDILVNSTSVGMDGENCPVADEFIGASSYIVDIIYNPPQTPLLAKAQSLKRPCDNGLGMLLYQGIEAFEIWTGRKAPVEIMEKSLKKSLELE